MTIRRTLAALAAAATLTLAACGTDNNGDSPATESAKPKNELSIGTPTTFKDYSGEIELTITKVQLGGECAHGAYDFEEVPAGYTNLQIWADMTTTSAEDQDLGVMSPSVEVISGGKTMAPDSGDCKTDGEGDTQWEAAFVREGETKTLLKTSAVPANISTIIIGGKKLPVSDNMKQSSSTGSPRPTKKKSEDDQVIVPEVPVVVLEEPASAPVIGYTGAPGVESPHELDKTISHCGDPSLHQTGTTFFTDGTSGWTQQCADQMQ